MLTLVACTLGGAVIAGVVAFACALWSPLTPRYAAIRIGHGVDEGSLFHPEGVPLEEWRSRLWVPFDDPAAQYRAVLPKGPDPEALFDRLEQASGKKWLRDYLNPIFFVREEVVSTDVGLGLTVATLDMHYWNVVSIAATLSMFRSGWPARCFEGTEFDDLPAVWRTTIPELRAAALGVGVPRPSLRTAVEAPPQLRPRALALGVRLLPYGILWPGLLLNTAFYGTALWALLWGRGCAVRAYRRRRQRCPSCNYDRRGLASPAAPCPECGERPRAIGSLAHESVSGD